MSDTDLMEAVVRDAHFAHHRKLIDFPTILAVTGAASDADIARAVEADARTSLAMGVPVDAARYASAIDLDAFPLARKAAREWCAQSFHEIDEIPWEEAVRLAEQSPSPGEDKPGVVGVIRPAPRRRPRRRAAMTSGVARVPWISIVAVILALGFLSSTGWSLYMTAREAEQRARADEEAANAQVRYEQGRADQRSEQLDRTIELLELEIELKEEAEAVAELKNQYSDDLVSTIDQIVAESCVIMPHDGELHIADGYETVIAFEKVVAAAADHDPTLLERFSESRLDDLVMSTLRLVYGDEPALDKVHEVLAGIEDDWIERQRNSIYNRDN